MATHDDKPPPIVLSGKDALDFIDEQERRHDLIRREALARSKAEAAARGKEPFDLEKLEQLCDTSSEGRLAPLEKRSADFEYRYYVLSPDVMTIAEFAALIEELNKW